MITLTFHGAAETVTGSKYLLEADGRSVLFDCGLFQGLKALRLLNWEPLAFDPHGVDAVVLTHAHIDHIGFLPRFTQLGYSGPVFGTQATVDLADIMLYDSARNQEDDADYANRKRFSKHHPALPLYTAADVDRALKMLKPAARDRWLQAAGPIWFRYHDAGHLLGSASIEVEVRTGERPLRIVFSGDVGRYGAPLYHDPIAPPECDYLICESTYGNREHPVENVFDEVAEVVQETIARGGVIVVPAFAVGRAQQLIYLLSVLIHRGRIPELPIYLDSPMSVAANQVYCDHARDHDLSEMASSTASDGLRARNVHLCRSAEESKRINDVNRPAVIIASSGMMVGGRILHHMRQRLPEPRNTILLGGFMAEGTRGRQLQNGAKYLRIHGRDVPVRAQVREMSSLSGHAGRGELLRWLSAIHVAPQRVFLTHGEKEGAVALADELRTSRGWNTHVPRLGETAPLR